MFSTDEYTYGTGCTSQHIESPAVAQACLAGVGTIFTEHLTYTDYCMRWNEPEVRTTAMLLESAKGEWVVAMVSGEEGTVTTFGQERDARREFEGLLL